MNNSSIQDDIFYPIVANILKQNIMVKETEYNFQMPIDDNDYFLKKFFNLNEEIINKECSFGPSKIDFKLVPLNLVYRIESDNTFIVHKKYDNSIFQDGKTYNFNEFPLLSNETMEHRILKNEYFNEERKTFDGYIIPDFFVLRKNEKDNSYISYIYNNNNNLNNYNKGKWNNFYKNVLDGSDNTIFNQQEVTFPFNEIKNNEIDNTTSNLRPNLVINNLYIDVNNSTFYEHLTPLGKKKLVNNYNDYLEDIRRKNPLTGGKARKTRSKKSRKIRVKKYRKSKQVRIKKFKKTNKNKKITKRFRKTNKSRKVRR